MGTDATSLENHRFFTFPGHVVDVVSDPESGRIENVVIDSRSMDFAALDESDLSAIGVDVYEINRSAPGAFLKQLQTQQDAYGNLVAFASPANTLDERVSAARALVRSQTPLSAPQRDIARTVFHSNSDETLRIYAAYLATDSLFAHDAELNAYMESRFASLGKTGEPLIDLILLKTKQGGASGLSEGEIAAVENFLAVASSSDLAREAVRLLHAKSADTNWAKLWSVVFSPDTAAYPESVRRCFASAVSTDSRQDVAIRALATALPGFLSPHAPEEQVRLLGGGLQMIPDRLIGRVFEAYVVKPAADKALHERITAVFIKKYYNLDAVHRQGPERLFISHGILADLALSGDLKRLVYFCEVTGRTPADLELIRNGSAPPVYARGKPTYVPDFIQTINALNGYWVRRMEALRPAFTRDSKTLVFPQGEDEDAFFLDLFASALKALHEQNDWREVSVIDAALDESDACAWLDERGYAAFDGHESEKTLGRWFRYDHTLTLIANQHPDRAIRRKAGALLEAYAPGFFDWVGYGAAYAIGKSADVFVNDRCDRNKPGF